MPPLPPANETCFIDANTFYYHFMQQGDLSQFCTQIIREIATGQRQAATTAIAISEAVHKIMFSELATVFNRPRAGLLSWVKAHPESLNKISQYRTAVDEIGTLALEIIPVDFPLVRNGVEVASATGLLINDAITVAAMNQRGIPHLISNDNDFNSVAGIRVWKPR